MTTPAIFNTHYRITRSLIWPMLAFCICLTLIGVFFSDKYRLDHSHLVNIVNSNRASSRQSEISSLVSVSSKQTSGLHRNISTVSENKSIQTVKIWPRSMAENFTGKLPPRQIYNQVNRAPKKKYSPVNRSGLCPEIPPNLVGPIKVDHEYLPFADLEKLDFHLTPGGSYSPKECKARQSVAIVIPYRNREQHLSILLHNLHPFLQKQQIEYTIFVVNQIEGSKFNRAILMNIGYTEAMKVKSFDCFIFHDVDLIPENDRNIYLCPEDNPRHMSVAVDKFGYKLPYRNILGGIVAMKAIHFVNVNGYSNQFFGWGGEDDDFSYRCRDKGFRITRYPRNIARYQMIKHRKDEGNEKNPERFDMLKYSKDRQPEDGLNSLVYKLISIDKNPLYTCVNVEINQADVMNAKPNNTAHL